MRLTTPPLIAGFAFLLALTTTGLAQGMGGAISHGYSRWPAAPANPAPPDPNQPPPATTAPVVPPATNSPAPSATTNPEIEQELRDLRTQIAQRESLTEMSIEPLPSLAAIRRGTDEFRRRVDEARRQPFLAGARPPAELLQQSLLWQNRWGGLSEAIRAGQPPKTIPAATLRHLSQPVGSTDPAPVTGNLWSALSDDYFFETTQLEKQAEQRADSVRHSTNMRSLVGQMEQMEARLSEVEKTADTADSKLQRRALTWRLQQIWRLGAELRAHQLEQELQIDPGEQEFSQFLLTADSAAALRHRGLSLTMEGGAPVAHDAPPVLLVAPAAGLTIRAQLADAESTVNVKPADPSQLAILAAELYHTHYTLAHVEEFESEADKNEREFVDSASTPAEHATRAQTYKKSHEERIAGRRRDYEARRIYLLGEIVREQERLRTTGG